MKYDDVINLHDEFGLRIVGPEGLLLAAWPELVEGADQPHTMPLMGESADYQAIINLNISNRGRRTKLQAHLRPDAMWHKGSRTYYKKSAPHAAWVVSTSPTEPYVTIESLEIKPQHASISSLTGLETLKRVQDDSRESTLRDLIAAADSEVAAMRTMARDAERATKIQR